VRPLPWLLRIGLVAVGFAIGVSRHEPKGVQQRVIIELQIEMPSPSKKPAEARTVSWPHEFDIRTAQP
jgi:hypothetical protein